MSKLDQVLVSAKRSAEAELLRRPGVTGVDVGYKYVAGRRTNIFAIRVFVRRKGSFAESDRIPTEIAGYPTDVIQACPRFLDDTRHYDPVVGGISIGACRLELAGTLGMLVLDNVTNAPMALSNFHVLAADQGWRPGDSITQPATIDGGSCPQTVVATLVRAIQDGDVDAAVAHLTDRSHQCEIADIGRITGQGEPSVLQGENSVRKRGRTTGFTYGEVDGVEGSITIEGITFVHQIVMTPADGNRVFADRGDSGSVIVNQQNQVIGLLFAGDDPPGTRVYANHIGHVLSKLNCSICVADPSALRAPYLVGSQSHPKTLRGSNSIEVRWQSDTDYSGFDVRWGPPIHQVNLKASGDGKSGSYTASPLAQNTIYSFQFRGNRLRGDHSDWSQAYAVRSAMNLISLRAFLDASGVVPDGSLLRFLRPGFSLRALMDPGPFP